MNLAKIYVTDLMEYYGEALVFSDHNAGCIRA